MIAEVDILQNCHGSDFCGCACKQTSRLLCVVAYHHELVVELREHRFNSLAESFVSPLRWSPVLLIESIWNIKGDVCKIEKILLNLDAEISLISENETIDVLWEATIRLPLQLKDIAHRSSGITMVINCTLSVG